jgi:hypothetical protein
MVKLEQSPAVTDQQYRGGSLANSGKNFVEQVFLKVTDIRDAALPNYHLK